MLKRSILTTLTGCVFFFLPAVSTVAEIDPETPEVRLSLSETLRIALENNLDLVSAKLDPQISEHRVDLERSSFDPTLTAGAERSESKRELRSLFDLSSSESDTASVGVSQRFSFGGDASVSLGGGRFLQSGPLVTAESSYGSQLDLSFNFPILKGYGTETASETLILAKGELEISREQLEVNTQAVMETVEGAYWDLVAGHEGLRIARLAMTRARDQLELNRKKVEVGTLAPIDITQAEAEVALQQENVILAETNLENAEDELRRLLAIPESDPMWGHRIVPTDEPSFAAVEVDLDAAIETGLRERPELVSAQQALRNSELSERVARRATRPSLDLALQYAPTGNNFETIFDPGPDGIVGTDDDGPPSTFPTGRIGESLSEMFDRDYYQWSAGLNLTYAIGNRQAKASYGIAQLNRQKAEVDLQNWEQDIRVQIRRAARSVESGTKRVAAAQASVTLQRKKLEAEQRKFENGMSTSFEVLTFQNDLADAELREVQAVIDYNKAIVALELSKGTLLEARGLSLGTP